MGILYCIIAALLPRGIFAPLACFILKAKNLSSANTWYRYFGLTFSSVTRITKTSPFVPPVQSACQIFSNTDGYFQSKCHWQYILSFFLRLEHNRITFYLLYFVRDYPRQRNYVRSVYPNKYGFLNIRQPPPTSSKPHFSDGIDSRQLSPDLIVKI